MSFMASPKPIFRPIIPPELQNPHSSLPSGVRADIKAGAQGTAAAGKPQSSMDFLKNQYHDMLRNLGLEGNATAVPPAGFNYDRYGWSPQDV